MHKRCSQWVFFYKMQIFFPQKKLMMSFHIGPLYNLKFESLRTSFWHRILSQARVHVKRMRKITLNIEVRVLGSNLSEDSHLVFVHQRPYSQTESRRSEDLDRHKWSCITKNKHVWPCHWFDVNHQRLRQLNNHILHTNFSKSSFKNPILQNAYYARY